MKLSTYQETLWTKFLSDHKWTLIIDAKTLDSLRKRFERAQNLEAYWMSNGLWAVESQTDPGLAYRVIPAEQSCECRDRLDGKAPFDWCKHLLAAWYTEQVTAPVQPTDDYAEAALADWEAEQDLERKVAELY